MSAGGSGKERGEEGGRDWKDRCRSVECTIWGIGGRVGVRRMLPIPDEKRDRVPFRRVSEKAQVQEIRCNVHVKSDLADSEGSFEVLMAPQMAALESYSS